MIPQQTQTLQVLQTLQVDGCEVIVKQVHDNRNVMVTVTGKAGVKATCIQASTVESRNVQCPTTLYTFEIEYPRMVLAELNTHNMLTKNSSSSRAIPFAKMQDQLLAEPVRFGQANKGMQDKGEDYQAKVNLSDMEHSPENAWGIAKLSAVSIAKAFHDAGYHKQVYNRLTEPFQMMKTIISGTEWNNFLWLRDDEAADPSLAELAKCIRIAKDIQPAVMLCPGEWHLPYVNSWRPSSNRIEYFIYSPEGSKVWLSLDDAKIVSAARCGAVSYRNEEYQLEKCKEVFNRLVGDERKHASAFGHQATPIDYQNIRTVLDWPVGVSHMQRDGSLWSAQFRDFIMYRKTIPGENVPG